MVLGPRRIEFGSDDELFNSLSNIYESLSDEHDKICPVQEAFNYVKDNISTFKNGVITEEEILKRLDENNAILLKAVDSITIDVLNELPSGFDINELLGIFEYEKIRKNGELTWIELTKDDIFNIFNLQFSRDRKVDKIINK